MDMYAVILLVVIGLAVFFICTFMFLLCYTHPEDVVERREQGTRE